MIILETRLDKADDNIQVTRIDGSTMGKAETTPQGFLKVPMHATRTGVFVYRNPDGSLRRELRHPEDVFDPKSLATLAGIPIINDHPNVRDPLVMKIDTKNTRDMIIGYTSDTINPDGEYVSGFATIYDEKGIEDINKGKRELSCGYDCFRESVPGVWNGIPYDIRQRNIVYNHLALVDRGRAGPNVKLRLDSADAVQVEFIKPEETVMEKEDIVINGVKYSVDKSVADALRAERSTTSNQAKTALDGVTALKDKAEARADQAETELKKTKDQLEARVDSASDPKAVRQAAKKTIKVLRVAERVLAKETLDKADDMDDKALMTEIIKKESPTTVLDGKSDTYIEARFDVIAENIDKSDKQRQQGGKDMGRHLNESRADSVTAGASDDAKKRQSDDALNAWKPAAAAAK